MTPERWQQIAAVLDEVLDLDPAERPAALDALCGTDPDLRREVSDMLEAELPDFLNEDAAVFAAPALAEQDRAAARHTVGPYRILRELGRGGMGVVYLAERDEVDRQVALKLIRGGLADPALRERFLHEQRVLARLEHPHIARLYDVGIADDGTPFFALEYVEGEPLDRYCDAHRLPLDARLRLFEAVGRAVQHAHQHFVVHRDLKPSNILVSEDEAGRAQVKLLDFGIAKVVAEAEEAGGEQATQTGTRLLTPAYAAPEQIRGEAATAATDVYSLGVVLYELLTGRRPYEVTGHGGAQAVLTQEPKRPSTAVTDETSGGTTTTETTEARATTTERLQRRLRGDLDVICLKALAKEPERRYASAEAFVEDIRRHLEGLPVVARPATVTYRTKKFIERHRWGVVMSALLLLMLLGFAVTMALQQRATARERDRAQREAEKAEEVTDFMLGLFEANDPAEARGDTLTARELLDRGVERAEALGVQPAVQAEMLRVMGRAYSSLALYAKADSVLSIALHEHRQTYGEMHPEVARTMVDLATAEGALGRNDEADSLYRQALAMQRRLLGDEHLDIAETLSRMSSNRITMRRDSTDIQAAEAQLREAMEIRRNLLGEKHPDIADGLQRLSTLMYYKQDREASEALLRQALTMQQELVGDHHPGVAAMKTRLGTTLYNAGRYEEAQAMYRDALATRRAVFGDEHPWVANSLSSLARTVSATGDDERALRLYEESLALYRKIYGPNTTRLAGLLNSIGQIYMKQGDVDEAEQWHQEALEMNLKRYGAESPHTAVSYTYLSTANRKQGKLDEAEAWIRKSLAINQRMGDDLYTAWDMAQIANLEADRGHFAAAESLRKEAMVLQAHVVSEDHHHTATALHGLAHLYVRQGRHAEAEPLLRKALTIRRNKFGENDFDTAKTQSLLGACLTGMERYGEAEPLLSAGYETLNIASGASEEERLVALQRLADLYDAWGKPAEAAKYRAGTEPGSE